MTEKRHVGEDARRYGGIFGKGLIVGASMTVPGVSGGTMAMILGIYDRLIGAVCSLVRRPGRSLAFLAVCGAGGALGAALFARGVLALMERYPMPAGYFFMGAVAGSVPLILRKAGAVRFSPGLILYPGLGLAAALILAGLPVEQTLGAGDGGGTLWPVLAAGAVTAAALVLPGISVSQMLLILGMYERVMDAVRRGDVAQLLPFLAGTGICTLLVTGLLGRALERYPRQVYLMILGFVLTALGELCPGLPRGTDLILSAGGALSGFLWVLWMSAHDR